MTSIEERNAVWNGIQAIADFELATRDPQQELCLEAKFGSSASSKESFMWIIVSDEQAEALRRSPLRRTLRRLTNQFITDIEKPLKILEGQRPKVALVRESRLNSLYRWTQTQGLDLV